MYLWISGGGTGGHVYPALTVLEASSAEAQVRWVGRAGGLEEGIVRDRGLPFLAVSAAPMVGQGPLGRVRGVVHLLRGTLQAWRAAGRERPEVVLVTGGYISVPAALAAWLRRIPLAIFLPDLRPGRAVALLARLADRVAVTHEEAAAWLPAGKARVTGYPVRAILRSVDGAEARRRLGLGPEPILLVFGGSQGAASLNRAVVEAAPRLLERCQILQVCGPRNLAAARAAREGLPEALRERLHLHAYLHDADMAAALAAADLALCRAGASTLGELPARGLPAVLVPLPISRGHQWDNARLLERAGAARVLADEALDGERLCAELLPLLEDRATLAAMQRAARSLDRPDAPAAIWRMLTELVEERPA